VIVSVDRDREIHTNTPTAIKRLERREAMERLERFEP